MSEEIKPNQPQNNNILKFLVIAAIATGLFIAFRYFNIQDYIRSALTWIDGLGTTGVIVNERSN